MSAGNKVYALLGRSRNRRPDSPGCLPDCLAYRERGDETHVRKQLHERLTSIGVVGIQRLDVSVAAFDAVTHTHTRRTAWS